MVKEIRLQVLRLEHVRGIDFEEIRPGGRCGVLQGSSGAGKSTVRAAFRWLLTGQGRVLPVEGSAGATAVEAVLWVDGKELTLRRGSCVYAVDGLPRTRGEFQQVLDDLCPREYLALLTEPAFFTRLLSKKERAVFLGQLAGVWDGRLPELAMFDPLRQRLKERSPWLLWGQLRKELALRNSVGSDLPARYSECLALSKEADAPKSVENRLKRLKEEAERVNGELSALHLHKYLLERFLTSRQEQVSDRLERLFTHARFRWEKGRWQLYGGCVPYDSLSRREQARVDMELLNALSCLVGVRLPVFLEDGQPDHGYRGQCICLQTLAAGC